MLNKSLHFPARALLLIAFAGIAWACTDHDYDFDRTDREVTLLGEDLFIPLGQTGPLTVESLLGDKMADFLVPLEDGTCAIQYKGKAVSFVFDELKNIDGAAPFQRFVDFPISYDFALFNKPGNPSFNAQGEADLSDSIPGEIQLQNLSRNLDVSITGLPAQLASLKAITLTQKSRIEITVSIPDCLLTGGTVTPDLTFDMGSFFESDDFPEGLIKIGTPLTSANGYSATTTIPLHKFALDPDSFNPADHSLSVNASLKFSGTCAVSKPRTNRDRHAAAPENAKLHVTVIMRDIACKEIEGKFDYARRSQVTFQLGDLAAGLTDRLSGDIHFDFEDPTILLDIESNITIPISASLELAARQKKVKYAEVKDIPVAFPLAEPGASASKRFRMVSRGMPMMAPYSRTFSRPERSGWNPAPSSRREDTVPWVRTEPSEGLSVPAMMERSVDLPAPLWPMSPRVSPWRTEKLMSWRAVKDGGRRPRMRSTRAVFREPPATSRKRLETWETSMAFMAGAETVRRWRPRRGGRR